MFKSGFVKLNGFGFSLIEISIVLLIAGLLVAGAFSLVNNMQQQRTDQATANEMRTVVTALERFLVDNQGTLNATSSPLNQTTACVPGTCPKTLLGDHTLTIAGMQAQDYFQHNYLPGGAASSLSGYTIGLSNLGPITSAGNTNAASNLRGLVIYTPPNAMNDARLSRVAALIGPQGGMIPSTATVTGGGYPVTGVYGAWSVNTADYGIPVGRVTKSQIAAYTATVDSQINTNLLSRINTGNPEANKMETNLYMGSANTTTSSNDMYFNTIPSPLPGAAVTNNVNSVLQAGGTGYMVTNATVGLACGGSTITALEVFDPQGVRQLGTLPASTTNTTAQEYEQNMVVFGSSNTKPLGSDGGTGYPTNGSLPALLQCVNTASGWSWQPAIVPTPPIRTWHTLTSFSLETVINNPSSTNEMEVRIYFDQIANPGCRLVTSTVTGGCGSGGPPEPAGAGGANCPEMDGMNIGSAGISFGLSATVPPSGSYLLHNGPSGSCTPTGWYELY